MTQNTLPSSFLNSLEDVGAGSRVFQRQDASTLPAEPGAYALILDVMNEFPLARPKCLGNFLDVGWYIYAGSAHGPGGIGARVARHLRKGKPIHWHIDQLTTRTDVRVWATPFPDRTECDLVSDLVRSGHFLAKHPGFGSSDCARCAAHLLMWRQPG